MRIVGQNNMKDIVIDFFAQMPPEWAVLWISMIPVTELRASIPIGIELFKLPVWQVWILAVIGDLIPALFILYFTPMVHDWITKYNVLGKMFTHHLERAEKLFAGKYAKYGAAGLITFVGIPLPFTGSWTGSFAAFVFNIPFRKSVPLLTIGVCVAATVVTLITLFAGEAVRAFFV